MKLLSCCIFLLAIGGFLLTGLNGNSRTQVMEAMHLHSLSDPLTQEADMCNKLYNNNSGYRLHRANRIYVDNNVEIRQKFQNDSLKYHETRLQQVDFARKPRRARRMINQYVRDVTDNEIKKLVPKHAVKRSTKCYLVNAITLEAAWEYPFVERLTRKERFELRPNKFAKVQTMTTTSARCYPWQSIVINGVVVQIAIIPFKEGKLSMVFIMPSEAGNFDFLNVTGATQRIQERLEKIWTDSYEQAYLRLQSCEVTMPKFTLRHKMSDLIDVLRGMGITDIFDADTADMTKLSPEPQLYVSNANHEAVFKVDENGVKASAATSLGIGARILPLELRINKPFLFLVRQEETGATLFLGKVVDPRKR